METAFAQRVQAMGSDSGFTSPTTTTITANQESLQTTDPLSVGDLVIKILEHEVVWSVTAVESSAGTGAYTLESTEDSTITLASVERWELYRYCPAGTWLQTLDSGCVNISCSEGDPNANDQEGLRFVDDPCAHCGPGAYLNETDCLECPAGSFGVIAGHTSLRHGCALQCPAGRYGSVVGASSEAEACPGACSVGKFGDAPGATSAEEACPGVCPASTWGSVVGGGSVEEACPNACPPGSCGTVEGATTQDEACHSVCPIGACGCLAALLLPAALVPLTPWPPPTQSNPRQHCGWTAPAPSPAASGTASSPTAPTKAPCCRAASPTTR